MITHLHTVEEVIDELGGFDAVKELTNRNSPSAVPMWKNRNKFPPNTYVAMISALHAIGKTAPSSLWGMEIPADQGVA
jgi:hypothetical protein